MEYSYIAVEGNIGVGKTTLASLISVNRKLVLEEFEDNYFLPLFYKNKGAYAFHTEVSFLIKRYEQLLHIKKHGEKIIADYYFMKTLVFAKNNLTDPEFKLFSKLYYNLKDSLPKPDLVVYLKRSPKSLLNNIGKRGRSFEMEITAKYLNQINKAYNFYIENEKSNFRIVSINVEKLDFLNNPKQLEVILDRLEDRYPIGLTVIDI